jgi:PRC-barrel domain
MTLPTIDQARSWRGLTLVATDNEPVGKIEAIYVDRSTRQPEWALVHTGLFGSSRTFVPLADAAQRGDTVQVPHDPSVIREAPRQEQDAKLSEEDEARLYAHYGIPYTTEESASGLPAGETASADGGTVPASDATTELPPSSRLEADAPAAAGGLSAAGSTRAARTATRKAVQAGQQAATSGRLAVHKARQEVAAVVDAIETTPESKRKARRRARARKRALGTAAGAVRSVAAALAAAWRWVRKSDAG